jgi:hypothetical protein
VSEKNHPPARDILERAAEALRNAPVPAEPPDRLVTATLREIEMGRVPQGDHASALQADMAPSATRRHVPAADGPCDSLGDPIDVAPAVAGGRVKALLWRWLLAAPVGLVLAVIVAAAVWYLLPPGKHMAFVKLYMPMHPDGGFREHPEADIDFVSFQRTQFALFKSRPILEAALRDPRVQPLDLHGLTKGRNPVDWLEEEVRVQMPDGPELPRVVLSGDDPEPLKVLLTALVDVYLAEVVDKRAMAHRVARLEKLEAVRELYAGRLKSIREMNRKLALAVGGNGNRLVELRLEPSMKELADAKGQLVKVRSQLKQAEFDAAIAEKRVLAAAALVDTDEAAEELVEKALAKDIAERDKLQAALDANLKANPDENLPRAKALRTALDDKNAFIEEQRKLLRLQYREELQKQAQSTAQSDLALLQEKIKYLKALEGALVQEVEGLTGLANKLKADAPDLGDALVELKQAEAGYQKVMGEIDALKVEVQAPRRVTRWEDAVVVPPDDGPRKWKAAALAGLGAFGAVLLLASFMTRSHRA